MRHIARLLGEPLVHFLAIGGALFLLYGAADGPRSGPSDTIVVGPDRIARLAAGYEAVWRRPPSADELRAIIDEFVREEIYYREALALGLDRDDTVVRRRLRQKMEFLTDSGADLLEPVAGELEAYLAANEESYRRGPRVSFEQIYLGERPAPEGAARALSDLRSGLVSDPSTLGERFLLPAQFDRLLPTQIDTLFGKGVFARLAELPVGEWAGPVETAYGLHLVRIVERVASSMPPLEEVREAVLRDWKSAKALEVREGHYARLRARFVVEIHDADPPAVVSR